MSVILINSNYKIIIPNKIIFILGFTIINLSFLPFSVKADWVQVNNGLTNLNVNALCSYTSSGVNYLFAGTLWAAQCGVYLSTNNGNTWTLNWINNTDVWALATTVSGGVNYVYLGGGNLFGYTTNNGVNWYSLILPNGSHWYYSVAASGNYVFAGCKWWSNDSGGVYKSTNYGTNWVRTLYGPEINALAINGNYVFAGAGRGANLVVGVFEVFTKSRTSPEHSG